jgi:hypothetical protein
MRASPNEAAVEQILKGFLHRTNLKHAVQSTQGVGKGIPALQEFLRLRVKRGGRHVA